MLSTSFLMQLKQILPEKECQTVTTSLRQDPLIWASLGDTTFSEKAIAAADDQMEKWNPGLLAVLSIPPQYSKNNPNHLISKSLEPELRQNAIFHFEQALLSERKPSSLEEAAWIALALKERRRLKNSWLGIREELTVKQTETTGSLFETWATPIACAYSLVPDGADLLKALLPVRHQDHFEDLASICLHAILCTPNSLDEQSNRLVDLVKDIHPDLQLKFLGQLWRWGKHSLAQLVSQALLKTENLVSYFYDLFPQPFDEEIGAAQGSEKNIDPLATDEPLLPIEKLNQLSAYYRYSGDNEKAEEALLAAREANRRVDARLVSRMALLAESQKNYTKSKNSWEQAVQLVPNSKIARLKLAVSTMTSNASSYDEPAILSQDPSPIAKMARLNVSIQGSDLEMSRSIAHEIVDQPDTLTTPSNEGADLLGFESSPQPADLLPVLLDLDMIPEAVTLARRFLSRPSDGRQLLESAVRTFLKAHSVDEAIEAGLMATIADPAGQDSHRLLAEAFEAAQAFEKAYDERSFVIDRSENPGIDDQLALASTALEIDRVDKAISTVESILSVDPENGMAHHLIGKALSRQSDFTNAIDHFTQATVLSPERPEPWLALSQAFAVTGEHQKSLDTLRSASQSIPQSPDILFALGQSSLVAGYPSEALPNLRKAFSLDQTSSQIAFKLSETLFDLGHFEEAEQTLSQARNSNSTDTRLAFLHGQIYLALGDKQSARKALQESISPSMPDSNTAILLAQTTKSVIEEAEFNEGIAGLDVDDSGAVVSSDDFIHIIDALEKALSITPGDPEARILLAEMQLEAGLSQIAYDAYSNLSNQKGTASQDWQSRVSLGLGKAALKLGQTELAITSLQEAASADPDNIALLRALADALKSADLTREALQTARAGLMIAPDDVDNAIWFAKTAVSLGAASEAIDALNHLLQENPDDAKVLLSLGKAHLEIGDKEAAQRILSPIPGLPEVSIAQLRKAAGLSMQMDNYTHAISCLEAAVSKGEHPSWKLYSELANAYYRSGDITAALKAAQDAIANNSTNPGLFVLQADLLANLNQDLDSLQSLEHALHLKKNGASTPNGIYSRFASLLNKTGKLDDALHYAKEALKEDPADINALSLTAELAYGLMDDELALQYSQSQNALGQTSDRSHSITKQQIESFVSLAAIQADLLFQDAKEAVTEAINRGLSFIHDHPQLLAIQARLAHKDGNLDEANRLLVRALSAWECRGQQSKTTVIPVDENVSRTLRSTWAALSIGETALEMKQWQTALASFQAAVRTSPQQPRTHIRFARAIAIMAENQEICDAVRVTAHAPGSEILGSDFQRQFEQQIEISSHLSSNHEIGHWLTRGRAIYDPCFETLKDMSEVVSGSDDVAACVAAFHRSGSISDASSTAQPYLDNSTVALQLALALREVDPTTSFGLVQNLLVQDDTNPIYYAMLAFLSQNEPLEAYQYIEKAIEMWPEEIEWRKFAAGLCTQVGDAPSALSHWQQIVDLVPEKPAYNISLGKAFHTNGEYEQAIVSYEQANRQEPDQLETWKLLAEAYLDSGNTEKANQAIDHCITINGDDFATSLLSCRIDLASSQSERALQKIKQILVDRPSDSEAQVIYVKALKETGQTDEALEAIDQAVNSVDNPFGLLLEKAYLVKQIQGSQAVLPSLLELTNAYPNEPDVLALLAETFSELGEFDTAEKTAQATLRLAPDHSNMHLLLGHIQRQKGQLDQSVYHLDEVIRKTPAQVDAYLELGRVYQDRREHLQALKTYHQAAQIAPEDFRPYFQAGLVLRESKDYIKAESMFRRAARLAPNDLNVKRQLGAVITLNLVHNPQEAMVSHEY